MYIDKIGDILENNMTNLSVYMVSAQRLSACCRRAQKGGKERNSERPGGRTSGVGTRSGRELPGVLAYRGALAGLSSTDSERAGPTVNVLGGM